MVLREKCTQTNQSSIIPNKCCGFKMKEGLQFISALLLPLVLGVFTAVITIQQQNTAREQRNQDRNAAENQRHEDQMAAKQLRELEGSLSENRYKDDAFDAYIKEIGQILTNNNGSLTSNLVAATFARAKTLTIFRRLDAKRNIQIIRFLYEAGQLGEKDNLSSLDLSTAELHEIDFHYLAINKKKLNDLSLAGVFLRNTTFTCIEIDRANFSSTQLDNVSFSLAQLENVDFTFATFNNANFSSAELGNVNLAFSSICNATFSSASLFDTNLSNARLENIDFSFALLQNLDFSKARLVNVSFAHARLFNVVFEFGTLHDIDFSFAKLSHPVLIVAQLVHVIFSSAVLGNIHKRFTFF